jgi:hypothetical protein
VVFRFSTPCFTTWNRERFPCSRSEWVSFIPPSDFFQLLSILSSFGFQWPVQLKSMFNILSFASFNDQMVAPECSVATWGFKQKWYLSQALPVILALALGVCYLVAHTWVRACPVNKLLPRR